MLKGDWEKYQRLANALCILQGQDSPFLSPGCRSAVVETSRQSRKLSSYERSELPHKKALSHHYMLEQIWEQEKTAWIFWRVPEGQDWCCLHPPWLLITHVINTHHPMKDGKFGANFEYETGVWVGAPSSPKLTYLKLFSDDLSK